MLAAMKMLGRVLIFRRIATTHMAAFQAQPQMDPCIADLDAILANINIGRFKFDLI
jgi:hypothetical protein